MNLSSERIFDTLVDTKIIHVATKENFSLREYVKTDGKSPVILTITGNKQRERFQIDVEVNPKDWNIKKQRLNPISRENTDLNLILDNIVSKITAIKTSYRLANRFLNPKMLRQEFFSGMPRVNFCAFFTMALENEKIEMKIGSYKRHSSVLKKIKEFNSEVSFMELDLDWFLKYKRHLIKLGNAKTTIAANMASIKKFLNIAQRSGIRLCFNIDDLEIGSTKGNRTSLTNSEVTKLGEFYFSPFINESYRLALGYFLFSCMTGLRISDVQSLSRRDMLEDYITFVSQKTQSDQLIELNQTVKRIILHDPNLFVKKFADKTINETLKKIAIIVGIHKNITFHVARHTFATIFIRKGGNVAKLQLLLGHSTIAQTMIYVSLVNQEANTEIYLLDGLF